ILCHLIMRGIGSADVDRIDRRIIKQLAIVVDCRFYTISSAEFFCRSKFTAGDRGHVDELYSPKRLQMYAAHESSPDDCRPKPSHSDSHARKRELSYTHQAAVDCSLMTISFSNCDAFLSPSSGESRLSSCSMESTLS